MSVPWRALEQICDGMVDAQWGEPVELHPMIPPDVEGESRPDPSRKVISTIGILVMPGAKAMGEGGTVASGLASRVVYNDVWLSINERNLQGSKLYMWKEDDRVYFPDRDEWYVVLYPTPSVTARPQIYLAREQVSQD